MGQSPLQSITHQSSVVQICEETVSQSSAQLHTGSGKGTVGSQRLRVQCLSFCKLTIKPGSKGWQGCQACCECLSARLQVGGRGCASAWPAQTESKQSCAMYAFHATEPIIRNRTSLSCSSTQAAKAFAWLESFYSCSRMIMM